MSKYFSILLLFFIAVISNSNAFAQGVVPDSSLRNTSISHKENALYQIHPQVANLADGRVLISPKTSRFGNRKSAHLMIYSKKGAYLGNVPLKFKDVDNKTMLPGDSNSPASTDIKYIPRADGKIIVNGPFRKINGESRVGGVALISLDGSVEPDYGTNVAAEMSPTELGALFEDNTILTGEVCSDTDYFYIPLIHRLTTAGECDYDFAGSMSNTLREILGENMEVRFAQIDNSQRIMLAIQGNDQSKDDVPGTLRIYRLLSDGSIDPAFVPYTAKYDPFSTAEVIGYSGQFDNGNYGIVEYFLKDLSRFEVRITILAENGSIVKRVKKYSTFEQSRQNIPVVSGNKLVAMRAWRINDSSTGCYELKTYDSTGNSVGKAYKSCPKKKLVYLIPEMLKVQPNGKILASISEVKYSGDNNEGSTTTALRRFKFSR